MAMLPERRPRLILRRQPVCPRILPKRSSCITVIIHYIKLISACRYGRLFYGIYDSLVQRFLYNWAENAGGIFIGNIQKTQV
jgi:hypothetical protein